MQNLEKNYFCFFKNAIDINDAKRDIENIVENKLIPNFIFWL